MMRSINVLFGAAVLLSALVFSSVYIVDEREKVLVLQFGRVVATKEEPGLSFKIPFKKSRVCHSKYHSSNQLYGMMTGS